MAETLRPSDRVRRSSEYRAIQRAGARVHTEHFTLVLSPSPGPKPRVGIAVSKKVSTRAVDRNRIKRLVREVFRRHRATVPDGMDVVFLAKTSAKEISFTGLEDEWAKAAPAMRTAARRTGTRR